MELIVDSRENQIKNKFSIPYKIETLDVGDFLIKKNNNVICLIERKTISDYSSSITDGRNKNQTFRINEYIKQNKKVKIIYLIEGDLIDVNCKSNKLYGNVTYDAIHTSICNKMCRDNFYIYHSQNIENSVYFIEKLINKCEWTDSLSNDIPIEIKPETDNSYSKTIKFTKKNMLSPQTYYICILSQIPNISNDKATIISTHYPTIKDLITSLSNDKEYHINFISNLTLNESSRRFGNILAENIYSYLINNI